MIIIQPKIGCRRFPRYTYVGEALGEIFRYKQIDPESKIKTNNNKTLNPGA